VTRSAVVARPRGARIGHRLAVDTGKPFRTLAQVGIRRRILAGAAVLARLVRAAIVQI
jgi:hypothetical protein